MLHRELKGGFHPYFSCFFAIKCNYRVVFMCIFYILKVKQEVKQEVKQYKKRCFFTITFN